MTARLALLAASCSLLAGCALHRSQTPGAQAEYALPTRNPGTRATVQEPLEQNQIDQVSMKAAAFDVRPGTVWTGWEWRDIARPALSPSEALEVRRAFPECIWKPAVGPNGEPAQATISLTVQRREQNTPPATPSPSP
jgi:hypothetical protein